MLEHFAQTHDNIGALDCVVAGTVKGVVGSADQSALSVLMQPRRLANQTKMAYDYGSTVYVVQGTSVPLTSGNPCCGLLCQVSMAFVLTRHGQPLKQHGVMYAL
jgi:hypothetical protein